MTHFFTKHKSDFSNTQKKIREITLNMFYIYDKLPKEDKILVDSTYDLLAF
jgi:hypothetical protein